MIAVMNVDLVNSTQLSTSEFEHVLATTEHYLNTLKQRENLIYSMYRGDEFQVALEPSSNAVAIMLELKLWLASGNKAVPLHSTISLALGPGEISGSDPGKANGETYILAGRTLDEMRSGQFIINVCGQSVPALPVLCHQMSYILNRLNTSQSSLLYDYVHHNFPTHQYLADKLATSRQNISERLRAAGAELLPEFIAYTDALIIEHEAG